MSSSSQFRIFSCDGGGFRGFLTSRIIERIEQELGNASDTKENNSNLSLGHYFDMYAGTSTGALIACGLAYGKSAGEIRGFYEHWGPSIFPNISISKEIRYRAAQFLSTFTLKKLKGITSEHRFLFSRPLFDGSELTKALEDKNTFNKIKFGEISKRVLVTAYDCWNSLPVVFDSHNDQHKDLKIVDILLASSAYPGGFPAHVISGKDIHGTLTEPGYSLPSSDKTLPLVDGGLVANNPALLALSEYYKQRKSDRQVPVIIASFGTGKLLLQFKYQQVKEMGQLDWTFPFGDPLLEAVYGGYSRIIDRLASSLVGEDNYFRFQPYVLSTNEKELAWCSSSPDSVKITSQQRKKFEQATFQFQSKDVLDQIAEAYLQDKKLGVGSQPSTNLTLQVSQRIKKLVNLL